MDNRGIREYLRLIKRWWWLLVVSVVIPMGISYYFASQQTPLYQARVTIMVGTNLQNPDPDRGQMDLSNTLAAAYAELVRQGPIVEPVIEMLGLARTPDQLAAQISTWVHSGAQLLEIMVTDANPEAAALIANALADALIRRSPASGGSDPEQQDFIRGQLEELQAKIRSISDEINTLTASLSGLTSAAEIQGVQDRIAALEEVKSLYQTSYASLFDLYRAESPNVLSLFDPAVVPQWPIPRKTKLVVGVGGIAGLGLALCVTFLIEYLDTSVRWERDGARAVLELPVLGAIPQVSRKRATLLGDVPGPVIESIRAMRADIFLMRPDHPFRTLLFTSPGDGEGKSFVLVSLATVLAVAGQRVIVVDASLRRPRLHEFFDRPNITGLADVLGDGKASDPLAPIPLQETDVENLYLLSAGRSLADPAALLTSTRFPVLMASLMEQGDVVLVDSPPVLGPPDATVLATLVEGTVLVVSVGFTKRESVQQAKDRLLGQQGVNLLGLAANRIKLRSGHDDSSAGSPGAAKHKKKAGDGNWLTLREAAECLGISEGQARRWCESGRLSGTKKGLGWRVDAEKLERAFSRVPDSEEG